MIYGGKRLENDKELADYPTLQSMSTIFLVSRLLGGASYRTFSIMKHFFQVQECCYCFSTQTLLKMPCGDYYCPACVVEYSQNEANDRTKKTEIKCFKCGTEWDLSVIQRSGSLTEKEIDALATKLSENFITGSREIKDCPGCGNFCQRKDKSKTRVYCRRCAQEKREAEYCFYCLESWKNPSSYTECGNSHCNPNAFLDIIQKAPMKEIVGVRCPSIRLCPVCGALTEHSKDCKHVKCLFCPTKFCFICLRTQVNGLWQCGAYNTKCTPAPIQTVIPTI